MLKSITSTMAAVLVVAAISGCGPRQEPPSPSAPISASSRADPDVPVVDLAAAGDEFTDPVSLANWTHLQGDLITGEPSVVDIGRTTADALTVVAGRISWVDRHRGFFLYKHLRGDFSVTIRIRAAGRAAPLPAVDWSLSGLLLRAPATGTSKESWIGYTVGYVGAATTESKTTQGGKSYLRLAPVEPGWIELRAVRMGDLVVLLRRQGGGEWTYETAYHRPDLPEVLQVGINAGTGIEPGEADLVSTVDWIRFASTAAPADVVRRTVAQLTAKPRLQDGFGLAPPEAALVQRDLSAYLMA